MNRKEISVLKKKVEHADVISFDVFDTLIFRKVSKPEDVFSLMENVYNIPNFRFNREKCQHAASKKMENAYGYPHANLNEIYEVLAAENPDIDWNFVKQKEIELEVDCVYSNQEMKVIFDYAIHLGKKIIATSDMYLDTLTIEEMLKKCGYHGFYKIYDSADCRKTKFNGDLYTFINNDIKIENCKILHIGDNKVSDFEHAQAAGWEAYLYVEQKRIEVSNTLGSSIIHSITKESVESRLNNKWEELGFCVGGPLYLGLTIWLLKAISREKVGKIYFLSRDGYILSEIFKKLEGYDTAYLYTSRRALLLAGITTLDEESLKSLPPFVTGQTIQEVLDYLNLKGYTDEDAKACGFENGLASRAISKDDFDRVKKLYLRRADIFLKQCEIERSHLASYLQTIGFFDEDSIIFDCGWNGSSQYLLDKALLAIGHYHRKNLFMYAGIMNTEKSKRQLKSKKYYCYLFDINTRDNIQEEAKRCPLLFELFFGAPHDSVLYYGEEGPIFERLEDTHEYKSSICKGVIAFLDILFPFIKKYNIKLTAIETTENLLSLINKPNAEYAAMIGDIANVDGFAAINNTKKYIANVNLKDVAFKKELDLYWPEGIIARKDISKLTKKIVSNYYGLEQEKDKDTSKIQNEIKGDGGVYEIYLNVVQKLCSRAEIKTAYEVWITENEKVVPYEKQVYEPLISIVVPVYNVLDEQLIACIESVEAQTYKNWELCMVDDCSTWESVRNILSKYANKEKIKIKYRKENGHIAVCTNDCISMATGEFIAFLDCDDILAKNALAEMVYKLNEYNDYDFIYSDEDKLTQDGKTRHEPFFKPDWSPDTFMSLMYTCHFSIYRASIVNDLGGINQGVDGAQDYEFTLRFSEKARRIGHVRKVLYHWREREESIASNPEAKPYALKAMENAKLEALARRGFKGTLEYVQDMYQYRVIYEPHNASNVSIIIPSKDNFEILKRCILSVKQYSDNQVAYEIIVVDNGSNKENKEKYAQFLKEQECVYLYKEETFNFSKMCNIGASAANGNIFLFLNDDTEILHDNWLNRMVGHAQLPYVGAVGAKLLYPNTSTIQHVGIANMPIGPSHSLMHCDDHQIYYYGRNRLEYNCIAVTAACLMIEKEKYNKVAGFDESFPIAYNDVVFNFALSRAGYYNVVRNDVILYHYESISRGSDDIDEKKQQRLLNEKERMYALYPEYEGFDPFYNLNMSHSKVDFSIEETNEFMDIVEDMSFYIGDNSPGIVQNIDEISTSNNTLKIIGWAFDTKSRWNNFNETKIVLLNDKKRYVCEVDKMKRLDLNEHFECGNLAYCGYKLLLNMNLLEKGKYECVIAIRHKSKKKYKFIHTNKYIDIN